MSISTSKNLDPSSCLSNADTSFIQIETLNNISKRTRLPLLHIGGVTGRLPENLLLREQDGSLELRSIVPVATYRGTESTDASLGMVLIHLMNTVI